MSWQESATARAAEAADVPAPPEGDPDLSIGEVCRRTGLSARTVRYYEELGLLPGVRRRAGGRRVYGRDELERLRFVLRLKSLGLSLVEIRELNAVHALEGSTRAMLRRLDEVLGRRLAETEARLAELDRLLQQIHRYRDHVRARIARGPARAAERASR